MTIFGPSWTALDLADLEAFLEQADPEPLLWEAKGTTLEKNEIRRQVCGFANSHEGGYLILGAEWSAETSSWVLDGAEFRGGEPQTWISDVIGDPERGVRPRPDFDVRAWEVKEGEGRQVAVVKVTPTTTPPCISNGTVYERLPGKTQTVKDPTRLADLYARGDLARQAAQASADRMAALLMDRLDGDDGVFAQPHLTPVEERGRDDGEDDAEARDVRFAVGVAATGNPPDISARLFRHEFATEVWERLRDQPVGMQPGSSGVWPDVPEWSQHSLAWRHMVQGPLEAVTLVQASWDGAAGAAQKVASEDVIISELAGARLAAHWRYADELVTRLGGFGDVYVSARMRRKNTEQIVMRRGPLLAGVRDEDVASLGRELMRAIGLQAPEP